MGNVVYVGELIKLLETLDPDWSIAVDGDSSPLTFNRLRTDGSHLWIMTYPINAMLDLHTKPIEWPPESENEAQFDPNKTQIITSDDGTPHEWKADDQREWRSQEDGNW